MSAEATRKGFWAAVPGRIVAGKIAYLVGILLFWLILFGFINGIQFWARHQDMDAVSAICSLARILVTVLAFLWMHHVYRSNGGKPATAVLLLALLVLVGGVLGWVVLSG